MIDSIKRDWFSNIKGDSLAGTVVALALIPEAIAFSIIAGVDPKVGLYASFCIAVVISFVGGRPGMISADGDISERSRFRIFACRHVTYGCFSDYCGLLKTRCADAFCISICGDRFCERLSNSNIYGTIA